MLTPWKPMTLTAPGVAYPPGAGFPNSEKKPLYLKLDCIELDNARMHHAHAVEDFLCRTMGCALHYSRPASPTKRPVVEALFKKITQRLTHRPMSTAGSSPADPNREPRRHAKSPPVMSYDEFRDITETTLAAHNARPQPGLLNSTPLEALYQHCDENYMATIAPAVFKDWQPFVSSKKVNVKARKGDPRRVHINFEYTRYQGPGLAALPREDKEIRVFFDRRDIRSLHAYTLKGKDLGEIFAPIRWQSHPHSIQMRRRIWKAIRKSRARETDPVASYFSDLMLKTNRPKAALELLRAIENVTGQQFESDRRSSVSVTVETDVRETQRQAAVPGGGMRWTVSRANHHGRR